MEPMQISMGVKPTKVGPDAKEEGYALGRGFVRGCGVCLIVTAVLLVSVGYALEHDIALQRQQAEQERAELSQTKKLLFRMKELNVLDEAQQEAKLVKVLSVLQQHFARDRHEEDLTRVFVSRVNRAMVEHKAKIDDILKNLEGNPKVVKYLKETLYKASQQFHTEASSITTQYGAAIMDAGRKAESKLDTLTRAVTNELHADVAEEKRERAEQQRLIKHDKDYADVAAEMAKEDETVSRDERDVQDMIERFREKVGALSELHVDDATRGEAHRLMRQFEQHDQRDGMSTKPFIERMRAILTDAGVHISLKRPVLNQFQLFVDQLTYEEGAQQDIDQWLQAWDEHKLSDTEMMLNIEEKIKAGKINPAWLHEGESRQVEEEMLTLGSEDHDSHGLLGQLADNEHADTKAGTDT